MDYLRFIGMEVMVVCCGLLIPLLPCPSTNTMEILYIHTSLGTSLWKIVNYPQPRHTSHDQPINALMHSPPWPEWIHVQELFHLHASYRVVGT
jgi:hypothetical protein